MNKSNSPQKYTTANLNMPNQRPQSAMLSSKKIGSQRNSLLNIDISTALASS